MDRMTTKIGYWVTTALVAAAMGMGGVMDLVRPPELVEGMARLGYPDYFVLILGAWKVGAAVALLAPKLPLLKEWAYAGVIFDLTGASASHAFVGDPAGDVITPLVIAGLAVASWWLRPASRRLVPSAAGLPSEGRAPASAPA
jgi:hypothetical protein